MPLYKLTREIWPSYDYKAHEKRAIIPCVNRCKPKVHLM